MRTILITGANSEIASEYVRKRGNDYDLIIANYAHRRDRIDDLQESYGNKIVNFRADLSMPDEIERLIEDIKCYDIDEFLHVAAPKLRHMRFTKGDIKEFELEMQVVYWSFLRICQNIIPGMSKRGHGGIVAILTEYTVTDQPLYLAHYISAKFALLGLIKSLAGEYAAKGVRVNGLSPGMIETDFISRLPQYVIDDNAKNAADGRNLRPEDLISTLSFLLSEESEGISGQNILLK